MKETGVASVNLMFPSRVTIASQIDRRAQKPLLRQAAYVQCPAGTRPASPPWAAGGLRARPTPLAVGTAAIRVGAVAAAGGVIQRRMGMPEATVLVLQGILFVVLLVSETFYGRFKFFHPGNSGDRV